MHRPILFDFLECSLDALVGAEDLDENKDCAKGEKNGTRKHEAGILPKVLHAKRQYRDGKAHQHEPDQRKIVLDPVFHSRFSEGGGCKEFVAARCLLKLGPMT